MPIAVETLPDDPVLLKKLLVEHQQQIHQLLEALRLEKHRLYAAKSEKSADQAELFDEADCDVVELDETDVKNTTESAAPAQKKPGRKPLPPSLPRVRKVVELSEEERRCPCGCTLEEIGEDISEQVDIIPAQIQVIQHVRKKYACKACDDSIKTAPRTAVMLPKGLIANNTLAYIITSKYADGLPLYRLSGILGRYGIELPRQTLSESVLKAAERIEPLIQVLEAQLMASPLQHMDETRVQVLNEPGKKAESQSYMWVQRGGLADKQLIRFYYDPGRGADTAGQLLAGYGGALMTDGYQPYRQVAEEKKLIHLCCWAHARRKFIDAQKAQPKGKTGKADMAISFIAKLYAVEKQHKGSDDQARLSARQLKSKVILGKLHAWLEKTQRNTPPKTALGKAISYTLSYWKELSRYVEDGSWPIDNNAAENAIRPFVIGRKAWLFSNSQRGARASANLYSLIETAKANGREPYQYLCWLFERLPTAMPDDMESLMPWHAPTC